MATFSYINTTGMTITDNNVINQSVNVYGTQGAIASVSVDFVGLNHTFAGDLEMLLVGPDGTSNLAFLSDAGSSDNFNGDYTFADGGIQLSDFGSDSDINPGGSGIAPSAYGNSEDDAYFGSMTGGINHAGPGGSGTFASAFGGQTANGDWNLYVGDDAGGDTGSATSWAVTVETTSDFANVGGTAGIDIFTVTSTSTNSGSWSRNGDLVQYGGVLVITFNGLDGNDIFQGGEGNETFMGGNDNDAFRYTAGSSAGTDTFNGGSGTDKIEIRDTGDLDLSNINIFSVEEIEFFSDGAQTKNLILTNQEFDQSFEFATNLLIDGNNVAGADDTITININTVQAFTADLDISGWVFQDWNSASAGSNNTDRIIINGDSENNIIISTSEDDEINAGDGDDTIEGGAGADMIDGGSNGAGGDTASYANSSEGVSININANTATGGDAEGDVLTGIENLTGSDHNDFLLGDAGVNNILRGGGGNDTLGGFSGVNQLYGEDGNDTLQINNVPLPGAGSVFDGGDDTDTLNAGSFNGGTVNLRVYTLLNLETLRLELISGQGDFQINADQFSSNFTTVDAIKFAGQNATLSIFMDTTTLDLSGVTFNNFDGADDFVTIEGNGNGESIVGSSVQDIINGSGGSDNIMGGDGNDILNGGTGVDTVDGGDGIDMLDLSGATNTQRVNLVTNVNIGGFANNDTFLNIENVTGSATRGDDITGTAGENVLLGLGADDILRGFNGDDDLFGGDNNDFLFGGRGADFLNGGDGNDWAMYNDSSHGVTVDLNGTGSGGVFSDGDTYESIERVRGSNHDDFIFMTDEVNKVLAGDGNDQIFGRGGKDQLRGGNDDDLLDGGADNDTLFGDAGQDTFRFYGGSGSDFIADFEDDIDTIQLFDTFAGASFIGMSAQDIVNTYGIQKSMNRIDLDFGNGEVLKIISGNGPITFADLYDDLDVVFI